MATVNGNKLNDLTFSLFIGRQGKIKSPFAQKKERRLAKISTIKLSMSVYIHFVG